MRFVPKMKWLIFAACALGTMTSFVEMGALPQSGCKLGSSWKEGCNSCFCTEQGVACTKQACTKGGSNAYEFGPVCEAGSSWMSRCNFCQCTNDGLPACTRKGCIDATGPELNCKPRTHWPNDCNSCFCTDNGQVGCTLKGCIKDILPFVTSKPPPASSRDTECLAGSSWRSACHRCECSSAGLADCVKTECEKDESSGEPSLCKPNTTFKRECNTCTCLESGKVLCSVQECNNKQTVPALVKPGPECLAGSSWEDTCNVCTCTSAGVAVCTEKACLDVKPETGFRCKPNTTWEDDCNKCFCSETGTPLCTRMGCESIIISGLNFGDDDSSEAENIGGGNEVTLNHLKKRETCSPGETFKRNCNTCHCDESGTGAWCTLIGCFHKTSQESKIVRKRSTCTPGDSIKVGCNSCRCNKDGTDYDVCTKRACVTKLPSDIDQLQVQQYNDRSKREVCKPNSSFQNECNTCKCDASGASFKCTHNECMGKVDGDVEVFMENEGIDHIERHSVCQPSGTFQINCNTCECNGDGTDYVCTDESCPLPEDVELFGELQGKTSINKTVVCEAKTSFQKDCNTCWCNEEGTGYFCTRKVCVPNLPDDADIVDENEELRIIKKECRPDEVFELDCNMCRCNADGQSFSCTRRACVTDSPPDVVDFESKNAASVVRHVRDIQGGQSVKTCQPGQKFRLDCNTCLCHTDGQDFACTRYNCHEPSTEPTPIRNRREINKKAQSEEAQSAQGAQLAEGVQSIEEAKPSQGAQSTQEAQPLQGAQSPQGVQPVKGSVTAVEAHSCSPGSVFSQRCNVCRCTSDGHHATCTLKRCHARAMQFNEPLPESDPNFRCTPGEQFKRQCNDCTCTADGRSVFCTLQLCDQDLMPSF